MWWWESEEIKRVEGKLDLILGLLKKVLIREEKIMAQIDDVLNQAEAAAKANSDAEDAVVSLLNVLSQQITDLKAAGTDPGTVARIQALADGLKAKADSLAAAIVANTPAA